MKNRMFKPLNKALAFMLAAMLVFSTAPWTPAFADEPQEGPPDGGGGMPDMPLMDTSPPDKAVIFVENSARTTAKEYGDDSIIKTKTGVDSANSSSATGIKIETDYYEVAGVYVSDNSTYTLGGTGTSGYTDTNGKTYDSAILFGATELVGDEPGHGLPGLYVGNGSTLNVNNVYIKTDGTVRYSALVNDDGRLIVKDSYLESTGETDATKSLGELFVTNALLIYGTARTNMSIGKSQTFYINSDVIAEGWAALSTDGADMVSGLDLYAYGTTGSAINGGYGTYADTNCRVWLYGSDAIGAELGAIIATNGKISLLGSGAGESGSAIAQYIEDGDKISSRGSTLAGGRNALMIHSPDMSGEGAAASNTGVFIAKDSTLKTDADLISEDGRDYATHIDEATDAYLDNIMGSAILIKSTSADIDLNNVSFNSYNDVLIHTVLNSDNMGNYLKEGDSDGGLVDGVNVKMAAMSVEGDILHEDYHRNMNLSLESNAELKGSIVSGTFEGWTDKWAEYAHYYGAAEDSTPAYEAGAGPFGPGTMKENRKLNWLPDESWNANYGVHATLAAGTKWVVTGKSSLRGLTIAKGATVEAESGKTLFMTVDGVERGIVAGNTYTGDIVISVLESDDTNILRVGPDQTSVVNTTTEYDAVILGVNAKLTPAEDKLLTLTVDGVEKKIVSGKTYVSRNADGVVLTLTDFLADEDDGYALSSLSKPTPPPGAPLREALLPEAYRTALFYKDGALVADKSVKDAARGAFSNSDKDISNLRVQAGTNAASDPGSPQFSAFIASGEGDYSIKNAYIELLSDGTGRQLESNDFVGLGAAISLYDGAKLVLEDSYIKTVGVAKPAFYTDSSYIMLKNTDYNVEGGTIYDGYPNTADMGQMVAPPWVLGIAGNARGSNLVGNETVNVFVDSEMTAKGWGVVSSDSGQDGVITIINSDINMTGNTGYGIYAIGDVYERFYGVDFDVATYPLIMTGGTVLFSSYTGGDEVDVTLQDNRTEIFSDVKSAEVAKGVIVPTTVKSQFGVMAHNSGETTLEKGTVFNTKNASFLIKSGDNKITVDNSELNPADGVLLQLIDNDDDTVGLKMGPEGPLQPMPYFNTEFYEKSGWPTASSAEEVEALVDAALNGPPGPFGPAEDPRKTVSFDLTNATLSGDLFNASGYKYNSYVYEGALAESEAAPKAMKVTLGAGAELTGRVSTSRSMHVLMDWVADASYTQGGYYAYRTAKKNTAGEGDTITVDGKNYVQATGFTIDEYYNLGHVVNEPGAYSAATAELTLKDGAKWNVTGNSYLTSLTIDGTSSIASADSSKTLSMTVNGVATPIEKNKTYTGAITLSLAGTGGGGGGGGITPPPAVTEDESATQTGGETAGSGTSSGASGGFTDAAAISDWAQVYVQRLVAAGVISGRTNGSFDPKGNVTRAEFTKMLVLALDLRAESSANPFSDVRSSDWFNEYVVTAVSNGLITGVSEDSFAPKTNITRQDLCTILYRALLKLGIALPTPETAGFSDDAAIDAYAKDAVSVMKQLGIISGRTDGNFDPKAFATREEAAKIICGVMDVAEAGN